MPVTTPSIPAQKSESSIAVSALAERIITSHNGIDAFRDAFSSIIRDRSVTSQLAWRMFLRDTQAAYRHSFLGYFWLLLPALANTVVWVFLNSQKVVNIDSGDLPYPLFVFTGTALWTAFNGSLVGTLGIVDEARGTLSKVNFPHEAMVLTAFCKSLLNAMVTAVFVIPFLLFYHVELRLSMLLFPVGLMAHILCGTAIGLFCVPISALFSDLGRAIHLGLRFGFFLTPVIFQVPTTGWGRTLMLLNPVTPLLVSSRAWLIGGEVSMLPGFIVVLISSLCVLSISLMILKVSLPHIIERLSS